jgi:hypothetical protein
MMSQLEFTPPGPETPGFLRRMREALRFQNMLSEHPTVEAMDAMVDFLLSYVTEPKDKTEARELLLDASEQQFNDLLSAITGEQAANPT